MTLPKGFAGSFDDQVSSSLDLNQLLIHSPASTYFMRVQGDGLISEGADDGDIVIVDRALQPSDGDLVIAVLGGELSLKQLHINKSARSLTSRSGSEVILIDDETDIEFWGVVTTSIKQFRPIK
jgi:DNA polymerase V